MVLLSSVSGYSQVPSDTIKIPSSANTELTALKDQLIELSAGKIAVEKKFRQVEADLTTAKAMIVTRDGEIKKLKADQKLLEDGREGSKTTIDTLGKRVKILNKDLKKEKKIAKDAVKDFEGLKDRTKNIDDLEEKVKRLDAVETEKKQLSQDLTAEQNKNTSLSRQNTSLQNQLTESQAKASNLEEKFTSLSAKYTKLQQESKAYAAAIRQRLLVLQQKADGIMKAREWQLNESERQVMLEEAKDLKDQVADGDKKALTGLAVQVAKINALGEVIDGAEKVLAANYNKADVANAKANLERADVNGFSSGISQGKNYLLRLLGDYCTQYARVQDRFRRFNKVNNPKTTLSLLPRLMTEPGAVDTGLTFIRKQLDTRKANPASTDQPFTTPTDCK